MNTYAICLALVRTVGVALALASGSALATSFRLTDIGALGGSSTSGVGGSDINASGQATGALETADGSIHAFLWNGTTLLDLGALGARLVRASRSTTRGRTGTANTTDGAFHPFLWDGTRMRDLHTL